MKPASLLEAPHKRLKRLAQAAFWFFLLKGLAWLMVPAILAAGWWLG